MIICGNECKVTSLSRGRVITILAEGFKTIDELPAVQSLYLYMNSENNLTLHQGLMLIFQSSRPGTFHLSIRNLDMPTVYPDVL